MHVLRVYTGDDGQSHFEDLEIPMREVPSGSVSERLPVNGAIFRETGGNRTLDFHPAPWRQLCLLVRGRSEIEVGDGTVRELGPGDLLLADDLTGQGHISRGVGGPGFAVFLPVDDDFDVAAFRS